ncbi:hypothetical protein, partial [Paraburkholderia sp. NMBU_R16]|uniref:hypothetical protein n=1 Tax=Paraburkholderia sp. NMBU_R16 TaxID=2698676 RepID=UPI001C26FF32
HVKQRCHRVADRLSRGEAISLIVDSSGMSFGRASEWHRQKYGREASVRRSKVGAFCEVKYGLDLKLNARPYARQCIYDRNQRVEVNCEVKM